MISAFLAFWVRPDLFQFTSSIAMPPLISPLLMTGRTSTMELDRMRIELKSPAIYKQKVGFHLMFKDVWIRFLATSG